MKRRLAGKTVVDEEHGSGSKGKKGRKSSMTTYSAWVELMRTIHQHKQMSTPTETQVRKMKHSN
jgi:hypothetical protein